MRIGAMLGDISRSLFKRPATERYPFERRPTPDRLRGQLMFEPASCTGCRICVRDCPAGAVELQVVDKATKRFVMRFHADRCTYCAQCVVSCNFDALGMSSEQWELAALSREGFVVSLGREADIRELLDRASTPPAGPAGAAPQPTVAPA
jgi:formate hydrogenlyase subunit 6/NADH:ubiquinone oxidoreductase subunit I